MPLPPAALDLIRALEAAGYEAYAVGGCVRDHLRGVAAHDCDLTTNATPAEMQAVFRGAHVIETGIRHGTLTVMRDGRPYEITTYRQDGDYTDHRHPDAVRFSRSLADDLSRRDFTMNAIAYSPDRGYCDPFGGSADIRAGVIRAVGDPATRFEEDALRILRAVRFAATLGYRIEEQTARAMLDKRALLRFVSPERIREELTKLLTGEFAAQVLRDYPAVLSVPLPEIAPMVGCPQRTPYHLYDVWEHTWRAVCCAPRDPILRWTLLLHDTGKPACRTTDERGQDHFYGHAAVSRDIAERTLTALRFDNKTRERIVTLVAHHDDRTPARRNKVLHLLSDIGFRNFYDLVTVARCDNSAQNPDNPTIAASRTALCDLEALGRQLEAEGACYRVRDLRLNGNDLRALGLRDRAIGDALSRLLNAVMDGQCRNEPDALRAYLTRRILPAVQGTAPGQ